MARTVGCCFLGRELTTIEKEGISICYSTYQWTLERQETGRSPFSLP